MIKSINTKFSRPALLLICFALFCFLGGCGGSADTTTSTTPSTGEQLSAIDGSPTSLSAGQSSIITVKLTDSLGAALIGKTVTFSLDSSQNGGGSVKALNGGITDAGGQAVAIYTAPSTTSSMLRYDIVDATCESATAPSLELTITASSGSGLIINLSATVTSLNAGQSSIITAIVTNSSGVPAAGETVTFDGTIGDHSTMALKAINGGLTATTDASGKAVAVYTAGTNNPTADVQDTVSAGVNSGASYGAVVITRLGTASTGKTPGYQVTLTASALSLEAGDHSIITATVKDGSGKIAAGLPVSFSIASSSGGTVSPTSGTTDASGSFSIIYTAGSNLSGSVQDVISVNVNNGASSGAIIITRTATSTSAAGFKMQLVANPNSLSAGQFSILTATVTDGLGAPVQNITVNFAPLKNNSNFSFFYPVSGLTDASGRFSNVYEAGSASPGSVVQDAISATVSSGAYGAAEAVIITRVAATGSSTSTAAASLTLVITDNVVSFGTPVTAYATLRDGNGALVPNAVVTYAAASSLVTFTPTSATALTNASGVAFISINSADISSAGATSITASAQITSGTTTSTVTSTPVGIAVNGATVTLGTVTLGQASISAYGTSSVSVPVLINGLASTVPMSVAFTSPCVAAGKATLTNPVTSISGTAISTYKDNGCGTATDVITASVTGDTAIATITVAVPATNNIQFVSATPSILGTSTASAPTLLKSSVVKFQVVDTNNNGKAGVVVDFTLKPSSGTGGIILTPTSATSDSSGYVTTSLTSGTVPTPVWVVATIHGTSLTSQSNTLTITTGLPTQNFFSLSVSTHNIEGWGYDGVTSAVTIIASDRLANPVPDGTVINFISEGGHIDDNGATSPPASYGVCKTLDGKCTVTFTSAAYKPTGETTIANSGNGAVAALYGTTPIAITYNDGSSSGPLYVQNGRVTILAYTLGEKSFVDANGNNIWDPGETFYDLGDLYIDYNENGVWDSNSTQPNLAEPYISYAPVASPVACTEHYWSGGTEHTTPLIGDYGINGNIPSKDGTCSGTWGQNYVRREQIIVLSGSFAQVSQSKFTTAGTCFATYSFWLMDENYNPMPAGTTVAINTGSSNVNYTYMSIGPPAQVVGAPAALSVAGSPVNDTIHAGGTPATLIISGGAGCDGAVAAGTIIDYPIGPVAIDVTSPKGNVSTITFTIK